MGSSPTCRAGSQTDRPHLVHHQDRVHSDFEDIPFLGFEKGAEGIVGHFSEGIFNLPVVPIRDGGMEGDVLLADETRPDDVLEEALVRVGFVSRAEGPRNHGMSTA